MTWEEIYNTKAKLTAQAAAIELFLDEYESSISDDKRRNYLKLLDALYSAEKALDILGEKHYNLMTSYKSKLIEEKKMEGIISSVLDLQ